MNDDKLLLDLMDAFNAACTKHGASVNAALSALMALRIGVLQGIPPEIARGAVERGHAFERAIFAVDHTEVLSRREIVRA